MLWSPVAQREDEGGASERVQTGCGRSARPPGHCTVPLTGLFHPHTCWNQPGKLTADQRADYQDKCVKNLLTLQPFTCLSFQIVMPPHLEKVRDKLAENIHELWGMNKIELGWSYGKVRNMSSEIISLFRESIIRAFCQFTNLTTFS